VLLLARYSYAHFLTSTRGARTQSRMHLAVPLAATVAVFWLAVSGTRAASSRRTVAVVRAETLIAREDTEGARGAGRGRRMTPASTNLLLRLAGLQETADAFDAAIARHRQVLDLEPGQHRRSQQRRLCAGGEKGPACRGAAVRAQGGEPGAAVRDCARHARVG
jgi:hypothetical protein